MHMKLGNSYLLGPVKEVVAGLLALGHLVVSIFTRVHHMLSEGVEFLELFRCAAVLQASISLIPW